MLHLETDPAEKSDIAASSRPMLNRLAADLDDWEERMGVDDLDAPRIELSPDQEDHLRALGYLDSGGDDLHGADSGRS